DVQQRHRGFASQRTDWPKGADAPNNLYAAVEHDGGVEGDFGRKAHHRSAYQALEGHVVAASLAAAGLLALTAASVAQGGRRAGLVGLLRAGAVALAGKAVVAGVLRR